METNRISLNEINSCSSAFLERFQHGGSRRILRSFCANKKEPRRITPGPSDYQQKTSFETFVSSFGSPNYCALIPVMPVVTVMVVGMISVVVMMVVTMMIAVPSCGWNCATSYDRADNA
jgi:VIT1/CCC1 family predicted Fe2+/Mn2+ transporter